MIHTYINRIKYAYIRVFRVYYVWINYDAYRQA